LLEAHDEQARRGLRAASGTGEASFACLAVFIQKSGQHQLRCVVRKVVDRNADNVALWESTLHRADVFLEPPYHDLPERLRADLHAACEAIGVEQLQQG